MSLYQKVGIASLIMMTSVFLSRVIGLFREMVIAYAGGAGAMVDAYQVAFVIPEILNHILASGFLSVTFIPIFSKYLAEDREEEGWYVFSIIMNGFGVLLIVLIAIASVFAPLLIDVIAPGIDDPQVKSAAVRMTRIILPAQFFFFTGGLFTAVQFAREQFAIPALAPLFYNAGIIAGGLLLSRFTGMEGFSWGVLAGAFAGNFAIQLWGAKRAGMKYCFRFDFRHPDLKKYLLLSLPLMAGLTMTFSTEFFLKYFGSYLPEGSIAALNYGLRVMFILVGFFGQAVGVASFPFMARLAAEKKLAEMNDLLNSTLRYLSLVIPFSALFMVLRHEVVRILFQRGRFDAAATELTARLLLFLMAGTVAFAAQTVVVRGYYATQNTLFPAIFGTVAVIFSLPIYWYAMQWMGPEGVALAVSLSAALQVVMLYILWNRRTGNAGSRVVYRFYLKISGTGILIGLILEAFHRAIRSVINISTFSGSLTVCILAGVVFILLFMGAGWLMNITEVKMFMNRIAGKIRKPVSAA